MPADIVVMADCQSNYGVFKVPSSSGGGRSYAVTFNGSEGPAFCTCKAYQYAPEEDKTCKHIKFVWEHGCFYNPQWRDGQKPTSSFAVPVEYTYDAVVPNEECPACGGPVVAVRRAV